MEKQRYCNNTHLAKGVKAEAVAKAYLINQGLGFIERNYRSKFGEIDLIMKDKSCLVFVEVKYRRSTLFGLAYEAVSWQKRRKLQLTALQYIAHHAFYQQLSARFDVVSLQGALPMKIEWIRNAIEVS